MRLSNFTDYGLRMLMLLAADPERGTSSAELASTLALSRNHLAKIIQHLSQAGMVETKRGGNGGLRLAKPPQQVRLGALVALLEQDRGLVACFADPSANGCTLSGRCRLKARLRAGEAAFLAELDRSTLADIALPLQPTEIGRAHV